MAAPDLSAVEPLEEVSLKSTFEIRQYVKTVNKGWFEPVYKTDIRRLALNSFDSIAAENSDQYFELIEVQSGERCLCYSNSDVVVPLDAAEIPTLSGPLNAAVRRVFIDMDGVIVDFDSYMRVNNLTGDEIKHLKGAYLDMRPIPGALDAVREVIAMGFEVWLATKPPSGVPHAYSDKAAWVMQLLPELERRIIITHDKGLLGGADDFLIDDRPHKANCEQFSGTLLRFVDGYHWPEALEHLRAVSRMARNSPGQAEAGDKPCSL